jgi:hypothetical protein
MSGTQPRFQHDLHHPDDVWSVVADLANGARDLARFRQPLARLIAPRYASFVH